jgi:serine/threonine protein phosphatase PrpC
MRCGRQPGGDNAKRLGLCPAATDPAFNGFNRGSHAGRVCWLVAGSFCHAKIQGTFAEKQRSCMQCEFYQKVRAEEDAIFQSTGNVNIFAATHIGHARKANEDRFLVKKLKDGSVLLAVADGVGGAIGGDYAAETVRGRLAGIEQVTQGAEQQELAALVQEVDLAVRSKADADPDLGGMGTTLICVLLRDGFAIWVHVGDSRLYVLQDKRLIQITEDQTFARFLLEEGEITAEQVATHYSRHVLDQCVGCGDCEPETGRLRLKDQDLLVLTTDGLHKSIAAETMAFVLNTAPDLESKAGALVQAALDAGGKDNITIVIAEKNTAGYTQRK